MSVDDLQWANSYLVEMIVSRHRRNVENRAKLNASLRRMKYYTLIVFYSGAGVVHSVAYN